MEQNIRTVEGVKIKDKTDIFIRIVSYVLIGFSAIICLIPFVIMISSSFTSEVSISKHGYAIWPRDFSVAAYQFLFQNSKLLVGSYGVTIALTAVGTSLGLVLISMTGYALQRPDFKYRNKISFYIFFTTLFSGGLVPYYLLINHYLGLADNYLAVLLPSLMSPWLIILMKNFLKSIPHSITESAKIDGAGDFTIFIKIILPMATPALATVGLFLAIGYWNEWYNSMLFLTTNVQYRPLQLFLYNTVNQADFIRNSAASANIPSQDIPLESIKLATAVLATLPVMCFYPFVQKYFIKGITVGAVKG